MATANGHTSSVLPLGATHEHVCDILSNPSPPLPSPHLRPICAPLSTLESYHVGFVEQTRPDQTDQSRPDQTKPDQTRPS
mmetsp:Transcript_14730/g.24408  ORF Transcript_14730/g.24408 Transcript_14730/m.24408 type:complete len:80 (+) Transcript_14730:1647-1886(+)